MRRQLMIVLAGLIVLSGADAREEPKTPPRVRYVPIYNAWGMNNGRPAIIHGHNPRVRVQLASRLDWAYASTAAALASATTDVRLHDATQVVYQLWVPRLYKHATPHPLVLFLSSKGTPDEWSQWAEVCTKHAALYATIPACGNGTHPAKRLRLALDVLDDIRRRMAVDTDRIYVGGCSEGARTACELAFAFPEFIGGVVAVGGASSPRQEPWMRDRVKERLSIAYITGGLDPARREMEVLRFPVARDLGMRARLWSLPLQANGMPPAAALEDAFVWMESALAARRALLLTAPTLRMADGVVPMPEVWARGVLDEATARMKNREIKESGLMMLEGITQRWAGGDSARKAAKLLEAHDERGKSKWLDVHNRYQARFLYTEAKAFDDFVAGPLPIRDLPRKPALIQEAIALWEQVEKHGEGTEQAREASRRLEELRKLLPSR